MNTKKAAIAIAQAVVKGYKSEYDNQYKPAGTPTDWFMRGTTLRILQELWYDTFSASLRAKFDYNYDNWLREAGVDKW